MDRTGAVQPGRVETTKYRYDAAGLLIAEDVQAIEGDAGSVVSATYDRDERGLVLEQADRKRLPTTFTYDALGRLVTETGPQVETWVAGQRQTGVRPQSTAGYNTFGEPTHTKDPNGAVTTVGHNLLGQVASVRRPEYTPSGGQVIRAETLIGYDNLGNVTSVTDPLKRTVTRTLDPHGRPLTETLPPVDGQSGVTRVRYDRNGELRSVTDPNGATVENTYDELGRRITNTAVERAPQMFFITKYGYDDAGNLTAVTDPAGHTAISTFNAAGEELTSKDPTGRTTTHTYDNVGRPRTSTDPAGATTRMDYNLLGQATLTAQLIGGVGIEQRRWQMAYDPNDNLTKTTSPEGRTTTLGYDAMNRLVRQEEKISETKTIRTTFGYDAAGNQTRFVDGNEHATDYTFTPWRLPESTIEPATATTPDAPDRTWTTSYDPVGNAVRQTAPGGVTLTAEYDAQNRLKVQRGTGAEAPTADKTYGYDPGGRLTSFGGPGGPTRLSYDDRGNLLTTRGPAGDATLTYTGDSRLVTRSDAAGISTYTYDGAGRTNSVTDGLSGSTVDFAYDSAGRLSSTAQRGMASLVKRVNTYDSLSRLVGDKITEYTAGGAVSRIIQGADYRYDTDDNVTSKKTITNGVESPNAYQYDGANRLTSWTPPGGTATTYEWDDAGNRTKAGSTTFAYDARNQLMSGGGIEYTYKPRGTMATAGTRNLAFDAFDQLASNGVRYTYDSLGRVAQRNSVTHKYSGLGNDVVSDGTRLTSRGVNGEPVADKAAGSTATGKLLYSDQHGDVTGRYGGAETSGTRTFDPFGAQLGTGEAGETPSVGFQGEWTEPTTGAVNMHARWYNPGSGVFTSRDTWTIPQVPSTVGNRHAYGMANPLGNVDPSGHLPCSVYAFGPECHDPKSRQWFDYPRPGFTNGSINGPAGNGGSGSSGGSGSGAMNGSGKGFPPPPPPPLWQKNLNNPPPRPPAGETVPPPPATLPSWDPDHSDLIDRSNSLSDEATEITEDSVEPSPINFRPDEPDEYDFDGTCEAENIGKCPKTPLNNDRNFFEDLWDDTVEGTGRSADVVGGAGAWLWKYRALMLSGAGAIAGTICLFPGPHSVACGIAGAAFALSTVDGFIGCAFGRSNDACFMAIMSLSLLQYGKAIHGLGSGLFALARTWAWGTRWLPRAGGLVARGAEGSLGLFDLSLNLGMTALEAGRIRKWDSSNKNRVQFPQMCEGKTC